MKNAIYAQSGGVTSVINSSAYGVISELMRLSPDTEIYASQNGILGLLENNIYELKKCQKPLKLLTESPGGMFGSCRFKVPELTNRNFYDNLFQELKKKINKIFFL